MTIFGKIVRKEIPADILYEDDLCLAFKDVNPQAPVHVLVIPKKELSSLNAAKVADQSLLGHLLLRVPEIAKKMGVAEDGYRVVINTNAKGGQTVFHLHLHILGGRDMHWPPG